MDKDAKDYAKFKVKADSNYSKYKTTGSKRCRKRAKRNYALSDAYAMKLQNPPPNVKVTEINDSFKYSSKKTSNYGVNTNIGKANLSVTKNKRKGEPPAAAAKPVKR